MRNKKKKRTVLETAILLTLITGAVFPMTGYALPANSAEVGVTNNKTKITAGSASQWEAEWNAIAGTSTRKDGVGYYQLDNAAANSEGGLSVFADTVRVESTLAKRNSYAMLLNDGPRRKSRATGNVAKNHKVNITAGSIALQAVGGYTEEDLIVGGIDTYYVPVNLQANDGIRIAATNYKVKEGTALSLGIRTDSAAVSLQGSDITVAAAGKRQVNGIVVDTTQTGLTGSVTLQASGDLHVSAELLDDPELNGLPNKKQDLQTIEVGTGSLTANAKNIFVEAKNGDGGQASASIYAIDTSRGYSSRYEEGERAIFLKAEDGLDITAQGVGTTTAVHASSCMTDSPSKIDLEGGEVTITSTGDSTGGQTGAFGVSSASWNTDQGAAKSEVAITATKGKATIYTESKNGLARAVGSSYNSDVVIQGDSVAITAKSLNENTATAISTGTSSSWNKNLKAQTTIKATSGPVSVTAESTSGAARGIVAVGNAAVTIEAPATTIVNSSTKNRGTARDQSFSATIRSAMMGALRPLFILLLPPPWKLSAPGKRRFQQF